jgi:hypothetical protein
MTSPHDRLLAAVRRLDDAMRDQARVVAAYRRALSGLDANCRSLGRSITAYAAVLARLCRDADVLGAQSRTLATTMDAADRRLPPPARPAARPRAHLRPVA